MIAAPSAFATSYAGARVKFLEGAAAAGMAIRSHNHPLLGAQGETLAVDVALDGPADAPALLIVSSACHGVEGFAGSGVQVFATHDADWRARARAAGVAVLYIHALNPWGFSHGRRVTHENVDLNRNFPRWDQPLPVNPDYATLHECLLPQMWPPSAENEAAMGELLHTHGLRWLQACVACGQYQYADGLFYGGTSPTWSHNILRDLLRTYGRRAQRIGWIDLHTGLGPHGRAERILACRGDPETLQRANQWWGGENGSVTMAGDGSSASGPVSGHMWQAVDDECPQAQYTGIALEFGTQALPLVFQALRADQWLCNHPEASPKLQRQIRQAMREAFDGGTDVWRSQVVVQSRQAMFQAVDGLTQ